MARYWGRTYRRKDGSIAGNATLIAVTTFSHSGYEAYGREMLKSAINNWPFSIVCYIESDIDLNDAKLEKRNFFDIEGVMGFYQNIKNVPICHGRTKDGYNYNYDLWKFSRKMFAQWDVLKEYKGKVFWLDADSFIRKPIPEEFLVSLFDDKGLTYLGREGVYTKTGKCPWMIWMFSVNRFLGNISCI